MSVEYMTKHITCEETGLGTSIFICNVYLIPVFFDPADINDKCCLVHQSEWEYQDYYMSNLSRMNHLLQPSLSGYIRQK